MNQTSPQSQRTPMTREQKIARAIQRASEIRHHVMAIPSQRDYYTVRSHDGSERYTVYAPSAWLAQCSCKASEYQCPCWHSEAAKQSVYRRQSRRLQAVA